MPRWPKKQAEHEMREEELRTRAQVLASLTAREEAYLAIARSIEKVADAVMRLADVLEGRAALGIPPNGASATGSAPDLEEEKVEERDERLPPDAPETAGGFPE